MFSISCDLQWVPARGNLMKRFLWNNSHVPKSQILSSDAMFFEAVLISFVQQYKELTQEAEYVTTFVFWNNSPHKTQCGHHKPCLFLRQVKSYSCGLGRASTFDPVKAHLQPTGGNPLPLKTCKTFLYKFFFALKKDWSKKASVLALMPLDAYDSLWNPPHTDAAGVREGVRERAVNHWPATRERARKGRG